MMSKLISKFVIKTACLLLIIGLNWTGLSAVIETSAFLNDTETSSENSYSAGVLNFSLSSPEDFSPAVTPVRSSSRTISVINNGTLGFQYTIQASEFSGELCDHLNLEANVDGGDPEYTGSLVSFNSTSTVFSEPDDWVFTLILPQDNLIDPLQKESCQFKFIFNGWQDNLLPGQGFSDTEEILNNVIAGKWVPNPLTPRDGAVINGSYVKQCWTPIVGATKYIYQSCHNDPNAAGFCDQRWYEEYPEGIPQFEQACKWASNVGNATYWWRVKAVIGSYTTSYSDAWKIVINNSYQNKVVINEFLPNAIGDDSAPMPNGEWVELYNNKGEDVDVAGWWLYDAYDYHELAITTGNTNTGGTLICSGGFLVVYRNGDPDFALNNVGGDTVRLYDGEIGTGSLIDSYTYTINAPEGKSFARVPDGSNNWVDPLPTPGEPNVLEGEDVIFGPAMSEPGEEIPEELPTEEELTEEQVTGEEMAIEEDSAVEEESAGEEEPAEEPPVIEEEPTEEEENPSSEEESAGEETIETSGETIEDTQADAEPAVDEQPVTIPDDSSSTSDGAGESVSDGGSDEGINDGSVATDSGGEGTSDSGSSGDAVTE